MRLCLVLAGTALVAGCGPPTYSEPLPDPIELPPEPPKALMRVPPDFTFTDYETGKQYFFRRYTATDPTGTVRDDRLGRDQSQILTLRELGDLKLELVTVVEKGDEERLATPDERSRALTVLQQDWVERGTHDLMMYHRDAYDRERRMRADLIDERLHYTTQAIAGLRDERFQLHADLVSSRETTGYKAPAGHLEWLEKQITVRDAWILEREALVQILKYQKYLRDGQLRRSSALTYIREWLPVSDILTPETSPDRLIAEIKADAADAWKSPTAVIRYQNGYIEVSNTRGTVGRAIDYLAALRERRSKR